MQGSEAEAEAPPPAPGDPAPRHAGGLDAGDAGPLRLGDRSFLFTCLSGLRWGHRAWSQVPFGLVWSTGLGCLSGGPSAKRPVGRGRESHRHSHLGAGGVTRPPRDEESSQPPHSEMPHLSPGRELRPACLSPPLPDPEQGLSFQKQNGCDYFGERTECFTVIH